ncbi:MAG: hypothetical protein ACW9W3_01055 [Candidatus Nitrosopumilus sp. bin_68KS]
MVDFRTVMITIAIVVVGILLISGGLTLWSYTENPPENITEPWLQDIVNFANDLGNVVSQGMFYLGIVVVIGAGIFLYFNRDT